MSTPTSSSSGQPRKSALKGEDDGDKTIPPAAPITKAVQIAEPPPTPLDEAQFKKQFPAGIGRRLSGRPPVAGGSPKLSSISHSSLENLSNIVSGASSVSAADDAGSAQPEHRHRINRASERFLAQVAEWLEHEKTKKQNRKTKKASPRRKSPQSGTTTGTTTATATESDRAAKFRHNRAGSIDSESSDVSFDRLQRILDDSMASFGLNSVPRFSPRLGRRHTKRSSKSLNMLRTASSDTEFFDGDALVPSCDAILDNSKAMSYAGGKSEADDGASSPSKRDDNEKPAWIGFKNEIIRLAHTLKLKGWRRVPLDSGERISVQRLSGALTNAVYVVCPPDNLPPSPEGKKPPTKVLLRLYGPNVDIDRENELSVLRRLARKKIGPRLLGTFVNGRFEQFFNSTTLTPLTMKDPETSKQIAKRMRELHDGIELLDEERAAGPGVWKNWDRWLEQVERTVKVLDKQVIECTPDSIRGPADAWKRRGFICGTEWHVFKAMVDKYRKYLEELYGGPNNIRERLVFSHNDTQYGNILRVRPENEKSPLLQPANEHKQLIVIDFEYAGANMPGLEFANHFSEWTYNYHDPATPYACDPAAYPGPEQQYRFVKAYVDHRPQHTHAGAAATPGTWTPALSASPSYASSPAGAGHATTPALHRAGSTSSIVEFMLDARAQAVGAGGSAGGGGGWWTEEEARREEASDRRVAELMEEARLWRPANSAMWVAWGVVQARVPGMDADDAATADTAADSSSPPPPTGVAPEDGEHADAGGEEVDGHGFDYLAYAQERAFFFWGDCVLAGLAKAEELPQALRERIKLVNY